MTQTKYTAQAAKLRAAAKGRPGSAAVNRLLDEGLRDLLLGNVVGARFYLAEARRRLITEPA